MPRQTRIPRSTRRTPHGLQTHCARWTGPRDEVFNLLVRTQQHLSAKDIFLALRATSPDLGLATVYRTLELLDQAGLVRRVSTQTGEVRFEYRRGDQTDHHHHLICTACGTIVNYRDFANEELELVTKTEERLARKHGFLIRDHNIEFLGLCKDCRPGGSRSLLRLSGDSATPVPRARAGRRTSRPPKESS